MTRGFRVMLLGLSAACSRKFLALHLDRPADLLGRVERGGREDVLPGSADILSARRR